MTPSAELTPWSGETPPTEEQLEGTLRAEGLAPRWWSNGPGDRHATHEHSYHKVLSCARGSIRFLAGGHALDLSPGDRLGIPAGTPHSAVVGGEGVSCVEAARS